jgi:hypothetical protein
MLTYRRGKTMDYAKPEIISLTASSLIQNGVKEVSNTADVHLHPYLDTHLRTSLTNSLRLFTVACAATAERGVTLMKEGEPPIIDLSVLAPMAFLR